MKSILYTFLAAFCGIVVFEVLQEIDVNSIEYQGRKAIKECEANLPRTQTCVITAKPKEGVK